MNTILRRLLPPVLMLGLVPSAHADGDNVNLEFLSPPPGGLYIRWYSVVGRTYFVQVSYEPEPLARWTFAPAIESGIDDVISYELQEPSGGFPDKGFFRLKYTDQELAPGETVDTADFDHDGISNKNEVEPGGLLAPTDPLNPDTDGDGLPDGWERAHGLDPNDSADAANLFPGSGLTNIQAFIAGVQANSNATPANKDGDCAEDVVDADPDDKYVDWGPAAEASYAIIELEQESYGVWSPNSVETKVTRKASIGRNGLILYDVSISHKEPEDDHFTIVSSRTTRVWKDGTWSTDLSEQITPIHDLSGKKHRFSDLLVCGDHVVGTVYYSNDTSVYDPKTGGTRWNLEPSNGTSTRIYSPDDVGGSGNSVEGFNDRVATSPGGAMALVSGSNFNAGIAKWRAWFPVGGNATPAYIPGAGTSSIQIPYEGNTVQAIEDSGSMVVKKSEATILSEGGAEVTLPADAHAAWYHCICKVAKGDAGDSRLVVGATKIDTNGPDYENGSTGLWIKNGAQVNAAQHTPTIGRVKAIAKNGVILGKGAIWRNGQSIALDTLVEHQKVSGPTSAARYTNLEGLAMNGEGAIVATADDPLNSGDGHKTLILLLPVELTATPGKVHLGFDPPNKTEDDPPDVYWASVVQGKDNNILHLRIPLPESVEWRIDPGDEAMVDILPKTFAKETTDLTLKGKGNNAAAVETTINLVRRDQINTVLMTLKVLVLPQREKHLAIYRLEDPGAPRTQFAQPPVVDLPTDDEIVAACNDCFDQAGVHFTLHSSSGSYQFPYDARGLTLEAGYSSEFPLRASDGKLTADEKQALMESYTPLNGQERNPAADDIFPVKTGDIETFRMILIKESGLLYGTDYPGQMIRGFAGAGLFARNLQQKTQISLATAHEAGHILKISTKDNEPGSSGHHQPPFSTV
ncbi:MAG: hypothetical protein WCP35_19130, partial [Verrucomicrobiota bacterium]